MPTPDELLNQLDDPQKHFSAILLLGRLRYRPALTRFLTFLTDADANVRWAATYALGLIGDSSAVSALTERLDDEDLPVWHAADQTLKKIRASAAAWDSEDQQIQTDVLLWLIDKVQQITAAERIFVALKNADDGMLKFHASANLDSKEVTEEILKHYAPLFNEVIQTGQPILTDNTAPDLRFQGPDSLVFMALRQIMAVPLVADDEILGVIYADKPMKQGLIPVSDLDKIRPLAEQVAAVLIALTVRN